MARKGLTIPSFRSEREEAAWWDKNRTAVEADLRFAMRSGQTLSLNDVLGRKPKTTLVPVTIRLASDDIATARKLAGRSGIGYQTYMKLVLHDALRKNAEKLAQK